MKKTKITRIMMSLVVLSAIVVAGGETKEVNASQIVPESRIEQLSDVYNGSRTYIRRTGNRCCNEPLIGCGWKQYYSHRTGI